MMRPAKGPTRAQVAVGASFLFFVIIFSAISGTNAMKAHSSNEEQMKAPLKHHQAMYLMRRLPEPGPDCHHSTPHFEHHHNTHSINHQNHHAQIQEPLMAQGMKYTPTNDDDNNKLHSSWPGVKENSPLMKMGISDRIIWPLMKMVNKQMGQRTEGMRPSEAPTTKGKLQSSGLDSMYELLNHRFKIENDFDDDDDHHEIYRANDNDDDDDARQNHLGNQQAQRENWRVWSNAISYFPSGQEQMRRHWKPSDAAKERVEPKQVVQVTKQEPAVRQRETMEPAKQQLQEAAKEEAPIVMVVKAEEKHDDGSVTELDQQNQANHVDKLATMHADHNDQEVKLQAAAVQNQVGFGTQEEAMKKAEETTRVSPFMNQRARDSLLKAAGIARNLAASGSNSSARAANVGWQTTGASPSNSTPTLVESSVAVRNSNFDQSSPGFSNNRDDVRQLYSPADQIRRIEASRSNSSSQAAETSMPLVFLGQGDLQRIEGNARLQARLSCQFGDEQAAPDSNLTIWDVEWSKFLGPYNVEQREPPPFDCKEQQSSCELRTVKTDVTTTVHPRPPVQDYSSSVAPSYALTLHQVQEDQYGVYRCSAKRRFNNGPVELVYRVIPLVA